MYLSEICEAINGDIYPKGSEGEIESICIDSRLAKEGSLFFALLGENTDGHLYLPMAYEKKAVAAVTERIISDCPIVQIVVKNTLEALRALAQYYRNKFNIPFVGVTGSSGKTTTKDLIASVLSQKYKTHKTEGNSNSITGVPLTLFELEDDCEISVIEMGMDSPGEILANARIVRPETAVITNIGMCHIEYLKTRQAIYEAKCEIFAFMEKGNTAMVNGEDDYLSKLTSDKYDVVKFGISSGDYRAYDIVQSEKGVCFKTDINGRAESFGFRLPGIHNVINCMLAIGVGLKYELDAQMIQKGFDSFESSENRMKQIEIKGMTLINDSYNANPDSMKASFDFLSHKKGLRKVLIAGDMLELGEYAEKMHCETGRAAAQFGIDFAVYCGEYGKSFKEGYNGNNGVGECVLFTDAAKLAKALPGLLKQGDTALFKASHAIGLDRVFEEFIERLR